MCHIHFFGLLFLSQVLATSDTKCKTPAGEKEPDPDLTYQVVHLNILRKMVDHFPRYLQKLLQLCAWGKEKDACPGDSGGPLAVIEDGNYVLLGLVRCITLRSCCQCQRC